jgi:hypothetical protein
MKVPTATDPSRFGRLNLNPNPPPTWVKTLLARVKANKVGDDAQFVKIFNCEQVLQRVVNDPAVIKSLEHIHKKISRRDAVRADKQITQFLITVATGFHIAQSRLKSYNSPSDHSRDLSQLGKAAGKLAKRIKLEEKSYRIGTDRLPYLIARIDNPALVYPSEGAGFFRSSQPTISKVLESFAHALDAQSQQMKSSQTKRRTALNIYLDTLIQDSRDLTVTVPYALIASIASVVTNDYVGESTVRKRPIAEKLSRLNKS